MSSEVAEIAQKHSEVLRDLEDHFHQSLEEAAIKAHSNIDRKRVDEEEEVEFP